jgi:hypothetical protein
MANVNPRQTRKPRAVAQGAHWIDGIAAKIRARPPWVLFV